MSNIFRRIGKKLKTELLDLKYHRSYKDLPSGYERIYFYTFSYQPAHILNLPQKTFMFTCLHNSIKRIQSYYRMLLDLRDENRLRLGFKKEAYLLKSGTFRGFFENLPKTDLLNQIYMFLGSYNISEAYDRVLSLNYWMRLKRLDSNVETLSPKLGFEIKIQYLRKTQHTITLSEGDLKILHDMVEPEYQLLEMFREKYI